MDGVVADGGALYEATVFLHHFNDLPDQSESSNCLKSLADQTRFERAAFAFGEQIIRHPGED